MTAIAQIQASGLWKAKAADVEAALKHQMAQAHVITLTEADRKSRRASIIKVCKARGWGYQLGGAHAADDCGVIWDERRFERVWSGQVTCKGDRGKGDPKASCAVLFDKLNGERILVSAMHLPHAVDLAGRWRPGGKYVRRWKLEAASWLAETTRIAAQQRCAGAILSADWNINIRSKNFQKWFDLRIKATPTLDYKRLPKGGTHGYRWIDFAMLRGRIKVTTRPVILAKTKASDHRAVKTVLELVPSANPTPKPDTRPADRMDPRSYFVGAKGDHVKWLAGRLVAHGYGRYYGNGVDRGFTAGEDRKAVAAFQRAQGWRGADADGLPGRETLKRLAAVPRKAAPKPAAKVPALKLVTRSQWGARPRGATKATHPIGSTKGVTLHWEGPHMGRFDHSKCDDKVRSIERFHRDTRGWADIAYNAIVCPHGYVFEGRGIGVKSAANGSTRTNDDWYAVCYLGGQGDGFTDAGKAGLEAAIEWLRRNGAGHAVNGHRDHKATACPGDEIYRWLHNRY